MDPATNRISTSGFSYDAAGRVVTEQRTISGITRSLSYSYNLAGLPASVTYPSGRVVSYTVGAASRPLSAVDTANSINYALSATYAPQGALEASSSSVRAGSGSLLSSGTW